MRLLLATVVYLAFLLPSAQASQAGCPPVAQAPTPEQLQAAQAAAKDRGALWRLRKDGRVSYLYGTVHVGKLDWVFPGPQLQAAMRATEVLAVEVNPMDPAFMTEVQAAQSQAAKLTLTNAERARLDAEADAACLPRTALEALHPVMQAVTYVSLAGRHDGLDPAYAQELVLLGAAKATQRPVVALESVASQMAVLLPVDAAEARELLNQTLDSLQRQESRTSLRRVSQAWERGDLDAMDSPAKLCDCVPTAQELQFLRRLNDDRNPGLADRIAEEHGKGKAVFAAVGALHMTGAQALPGLLKARGFDVERVPF
ncbi:TraB/GumN family protein [Roseateles sp. LKC17W]|uniref:TraB/GumN family protein n=1 Tax=Pelomonas margarita TaxID=3299031 RepID=A0ABW7FFD9_9BURK